MCEKDGVRQSERGGGSSLSLRRQIRAFRIRAVGLNSLGPEIARGPSRSPLKLGGMGIILVRVGLAHVGENLERE